ncbi:chemotaxis protein CheR [Ancylothrix sp. C2]|uniref:CheR family methyltransferase n=1 Tax=Ancylothrix sp. D3o TaxID=2953691 RepID=UPI0021BB3546|nr:CheR family methyltransferase [Ancylothrix sp. D3o]MCT7949185.1 chemotaxis protein CheR [Ancylothrix sp. D3o]
MQQTLVQKFIDLIGINTGLQIRAQDTEGLRSKIYMRMRALNLSDAQSYYELLSRVPDWQTWNILETENEWKELTLLLTTGESYFFRDRGQMNLLETQILPELIEKQKNSRSLRIWSAGCSTGEEPYSLAILLQKLIPNWADWKIFILGTDINKSNLEKAKRGIYSDWSFRLVDPEVKNFYFVSHRNGWKLNENIRQMVTFSYGNLVKDEFPNPASDFHDFDLIICRNVFVYFSKPAVKAVLDKFDNSLQIGGYLLTAHAELHGQVLGNLQTRVFPESVIYQRVKTNLPQALEQKKSTEIKTGNESLSSQPMLDQLREGLLNISQPQVSAPLPRLKTIEGLGTPLEIITTPAPKSDFFSPLLTPENQANQANNAENLLKEAIDFFQGKAYFQTIDKVKEVLSLEPQNFKAYYLMAQSHANLGQYRQAKEATEQALLIDDLSSEPYYLLAQLAEEQGDIQQAKIFWKRIIYLSPYSILAYLELAALYEKEKDWLRAKKMRKTALDLLKNLPAETILEESKQIKVSELRQYVEQLLEKQKKGN